MSRRRVPGFLELIGSQVMAEHAIEAARKLPLKLCDACTHRPHGNGGHCYMFRDEPAGAYCAQFNATAKARRG